MLFLGVGVSLDITDRKQKEAELDLRTRQQQALAALGQAVLAQRDIQTIFELAVECVVRTVDVTLCKVLELLPSGREMLLRAGIGWHEGLVGHARVSTGAGSQAGYTLAANKPVIVDDLRAETRFSGPSLLREHGAMSGMSCIILGVEDRPWGVLGAHTTSRRRFTQDDVAFLQGVANVLAGAIQRAEAELARLAAIVRSTEDAIIGLDRQGIITSWNQGAQRLYGYTADEIIARPIILLNPSTRSEEEQRMLACILNGERIDHYETVRRRKDGRLIDVSLTISPIRNLEGEVIGVSKIARDITDRKRHDEELRQLKDELEVRVRERTNELLATQNRLMTATSQLSLIEQRERRKLAGDLHDYLAQMLVIGQMKTNILKKRISFDPESTTLLQDLDNVFQQALTYTRTLIAELSPPSLRDAGLPAALTWLAERFEKNDLQVTVRANTSPIPLPEEQAVVVFQAVRELLFNVRKHAGVDRATVTVSLGDDETLRVAVADDGKGLTSEALQHSVEPGHLGLVSVQERFRAMGGRVDLESQPGKGTTVTLILPIGSEMMRTETVVSRVITSGPDARDEVGESVPICAELVNDQLLVRQGLKDL